MCGVANNVGTTHLCIALSNYLHSRFYARTAYLEVNATHEIALLSPDQKYESYFRHQGVIYYPELTIHKMAEVLRCEKHFSVLDFGTLSPNTFRDFLACDHSIVVCHASIWKSASFDRFNQQLTKQNIREKTVKFLCNGGTKKDLKQLGQNYGIQIIPIPILKDPFHINCETFHFFEQLMKGE